MEKIDAKMREFDAVIIANGEYPTAAVPLQIIESAPFVACCDGGANEYIARGNTPDIIIGDGDSLNAANREKYSHILHCIDEQETNDQTKAVGWLLQHGYKRIAIVAATGKREDHTLGNISLLIEYMRAGACVQSFTNYGTFIPCKDSFTQPTRKGQQISIINFTASGFSSQGLRYPLYDFTNWWQGTLNEAVADSVTIECKGEFLIFANY